MRIPALLPADHPQTLDVLPLKLAAQAIASRCDGAIGLDYKGFNGMDTMFGRRVAALPAEAWTPAIARETWEMLRKYRKQLMDAAGIDYDALPEPPKVDTGSGLDSARQDARRRSGGASVTLDMDESTARILVRAPYSAESVEAARSLPGRRWNPDLKASVLPAEPRAAHAAVAYAERFNLWVDAEVQELASRHTLNGTTPEAPPQPARLVAVEAGRLVATIRGGGGGFQEALNAIKSIQGRRWLAEEKVWEIPQTPGAATDIRSIAELFGFTLTPAARELVDRLATQGDKLHAASKATSADLEVPGLGGTLYPFQAAGVAYALAAERCFIADEMGLGKTPQSLAVLLAAGAFPAVAVVPANLRLNWEREARKWLPGKTVRMITGRARQLDYSADLVIIGYDVLKDHVEALVEMKPRAVIMDEAHYVKTSKSQRTQACRDLVEGANPSIRLALTGTPVPNHAKELIPQLRILGRLNDLGGYREYERRYVYGMRLTELNDRLRQVCYVRRLKTDVLPELPPVQRSQVPVELSNGVEYRRAEAQFIAWLREKVEAGLLAEGVDRPDAEEAAHRAAYRAMQAEALVRVGKLRQLAAEGKIDATIGWIRGFLADAPGDKLIVFAHHISVQQLLAEAFPDAAQIVASKAAANQAAVDRFQTDPSCRLIIVSLMAGGLGFTLTAASHMAIVELPWVPKDLDQAEGRAYGRMADVHGLNAYYIHAPGTIDDEMAETIEAKRQITDAIQDGKEVTDVQVLNDLLKKLMGRR